MKKEDKIERIVIISIIVASIIGISVVAYLLNKGKSNEDESTSDSESASTQIGKSVDESKEEYETAKNISNIISSNTTNTNSTSNSINKTNSTSNTNSVSENSNVETDSQTTDNTNIEEDNEENTDETEAKEVTFDVPIKGEIIREFVTDSLVYSNTLQEWITHNGIDIKADKTSVVSAATDGTVYAIKNDPRYGLTVIINHDDGYQTIYSNLLTAEFVVQGEQVTKGQSIGTVGNSAAFEASDDYHLHFELLKDNEYLDPTICMNFE